MESLKTDFKFALATDIALAAITGDGIFNFGEVLTSPIVNALKDTPNEWLFDMLVAMNQGNIENFNRIIGIYRERYASQPALAAKQEGIKKKLVLMGLVAMVFERHPHDRTLSFADISARTQLPINQVEWVLMSALSQQLIKGSIDEVAQAVEVSWVIPRVLDIEQLKLLESQLSQWSEK